MNFLPEINLSFSSCSEWKRFLERAGWSWKSAYENGMVVEYKENR
jgi:hypothetical protein